MRFCPHCGAPLMAGAKFCVECGRQVAEAAGGPEKTRTAGPAAPNASGMQLTTAFVAVFFGIVIVGLAAAAFILTRPLPHPDAAQTASSPQGGATAAAQQQQTGQGGELPPGHPKVELPTEARSFIDSVQKAANANPKDVAGWVKLGTVAMRAALFDESYYRMAADAFAHVLKLDPDNLDALRGIGDIDYDQQHYDEAVAAYEHYLKKKPDDPEVRTDLGTMYLYTGNADQAVVQYKKAVAIKPDLYQAYYNLGVVYGEQGDKSNAASVLTKAIAFAPDDRQRNEARQLFTKITGKSPDQGTKMAASVVGLAGGAAAPPAGAAVAATRGGNFQSSLEQTLKNMPVLGPKVSAIQWPNRYTAKVLVSDFPMDSMPPFAKDHFLNDLKQGIDSAKAAHNVTSEVEVDLVDAHNGHVIQTVTE